MTSTEGPKPSLERSRLQREVCEAFLLGRGAGGPSRELSESPVITWVRVKGVG